MHKMHRLLFEGYPKHGKICRASITTTPKYMLQFHFISGQRSHAPGKERAQARIPCLCLIYPAISPLQPWWVIIQSEHDQSWTKYRSLNIQSSHLNEAYVHDVMAAILVFQ